MKLDRQNMAKTSFKLAASESCGEVFAAECLVNGRMVTVYESPNTPSDVWKFSIFSILAGYSPKVCTMFKFLTRRGYDDIPIILAGDFNVNVKDNYNAELAEFMKDTFELDVLSGLSQGTTRSNSCIDMVFGRSVDNLSCMSYLLYFTYHRPNKLNALGNFKK
jgi:hypothetical protein